MSNEVSAVCKEKHTVCGEMQCVGALIAEKCKLDINTLLKGYCQRDDLVRAKSA